MSTLAERKAELGHLRASLDLHRQDCTPCKKPGVKCDEAAGIRAEIKAATEDIKTWFAPSPDDPQLDLGL